MRNVFLLLLCIGFPIVSMAQGNNEKDDTEYVVQKIEFQTDSDESSDSPTVVIYQTDFNNEPTGCIPTGWKTYNESGFHEYGFFDEARTQRYNYNWGGNPGGGGSRLYDFSNGTMKALYWGSRGTNEGYACYGKQVEDWLLADGTVSPDMPEGISLYLVPNRYQVSFLMAAWKGEPTFTFSIEDLDDNVYVESNALIAQPDLKGSTNSTISGPSYSSEFYIEKSGYYVIKFQTSPAQWQEFALAQLTLSAYLIYSGTTGACNWIFYGDKKTLTISGEGAMDNYTSASDVPWATCVPYINNVIVEDGVTNIGDYAFCDCSNLSTVYISADVQNIGNSAFENCTNLKSVILPEGAMTIGSSAFRNCTNLSEVSLPNSITRIGTCAFAECTNLLIIKIPQNNIYLEDGCFSLCANLKKIIIKNPTPPSNINATTFYECASNYKVYVPKGSVEPYLYIYGPFINQTLEYPNTDVNSDEYVDVADVVEVVRYIINDPLREIDEVLIDLNEDDKITITDAVLMLHEVVKVPVFAKNRDYTAEMNTKDDHLALIDNQDGSLSINLENGNEYSAFQFDIYLAEGTDIADIKLNETRKNRHQLLYHKIEEGHYRVAAISLSNNSFAGNEGELLKIFIDQMNGNEAKVSDIFFTTPSGCEKAFNIIIPETTATDIENKWMSTEEKEEKNAEWYSISGFKLNSKPQNHGIYITNGKKIQIK